MWTLRVLLAVGSGDLDHRVVGKAIGQAEIGLQDVIDAAHDVAHHRLGRVVDAAGLAHLRVVGLKEGLVEVHHRVFLARALAEVVENEVHAGAGEQLGQVVDRPGDALVQLRAGDLAEHLAQEGVGLGQVVGGVLAGEVLVCGALTRAAKRP